MLQMFGRQMSAYIVLSVQESGVSFLLFGMSGGCGLMRREGVYCAGDLVVFATVGEGGRGLQSLVATAEKAS